MAKISGMEFPEPSSGGGGGITNQLMGIFRERSRAQKQLELMAYQSAMNVAGSVAKTKLGTEAISEAMKGHYELGHDPSQWASEDARKMFLAHLEKNAVRSMGPGRFEAQSVGRVEYPIQKSKGTKRQDVNKLVKKNVPGETPTVNDQPQTIAPASTGKRAPKATKGGFKSKGVPMPAFTGAETPTTAGTTTPVASAKPAVRKPRAKKPGMGQTPGTPPMGGMNA